VQANANSATRHRGTHGAKLLRGLPAGSASPCCRARRQMAFEFLQQCKISELNTLKISNIK
jgi:hypothetical protein